MIRVGEGADCVRTQRFCAGDIRIGLVGAFETTNPFGGVTLIIMAVAGEAVAVRTERDAVLVIAALETSERQLIPLGMAQTDGT